MRERNGYIEPGILKYKLWTNFKAQPSSWQYSEQFFGLEIPLHDTALLNTGSRTELNE